MAENTKIEWATHFSPWLGCSEVSIGCARCYAKAMAGRLGVKWGPNGTRRRTAESTWKQVERWNRLAGSAKPAMEPSLGGREAEGQGDERAVRPRVFPSLCDPFEDWPGNVLGPVGRGWRLDDVRSDFFALIDRCPNLDFLLLTKRPENVRRMWLSRQPSPDEYKDGRLTLYRENCWILYSASDQQTLDAGLPHVLACRDLVPVLGLSLEPLVGPVDLRGPLGLLTFSEKAVIRCMPQGDEYPDPRAGKTVKTYPAKLDLVIIGGESGPHARPMDLDWLQSIADQCSAANVPLFIKQDSGTKPGQQGRIPNHLWDRKELPA